MIINIKHTGINNGEHNGKPEGLAEIKGGAKRG